MKCPNCNHRVDPVTDEKWWKFISSISEPTPEQIMIAVRLWDEGAMNIGGHSVLPTELRDLVRSISGYYEHS